MPQIIPFVPSVAEYRFGTVLDDETYIFDVRWNSRAGAWFFNLLDIEEIPIAIGVRIVLGTFLARLANHPLLTAGVMVAVDNSGEEREAGFDDLGTRVEILRFTKTEAAEEITGE